MDEFNMYSEFITDNTFATLPYFNIRETGDDAYVEWSIGNRLDRLAYTYYNNAAFGKYILLANPQYLSEGDIEVGNIVRIPMPKQYLLDSIRSNVQMNKKF
jgi:hypothetical protein